MQIRMETGEAALIEAAAAQCGQEHPSAWLRALGLEAAAVLRRTGKRTVVIS